MRSPWAVKPATWAKPSTLSSRMTGRIDVSLKDDPGVRNSCTRGGNLAANAHLYGIELAEFSFGNLLQAAT